MKQPTLVEMLEERRKRAEQGDWVPACAGTEKPFRTRSGRTLLYCWQPSTGKHAYLDTGTDIILSDEEAFAALEPETYRRLETQHEKTR
jgi:hypothetical protein